MATYPGSLVAFTTKTNKVDTVDASHVNIMQSEITAIETVLGTNIAGSKTTLNARLAVCFETSGVLYQSNANPASGAEGQMLWRTDEDALYIYDGAAWDNMLSVSDNSIGTAKLINTSVTNEKLIGQPYIIDQRSAEAWAAGLSPTNCLWYNWGTAYRTVYQLVFEKRPSLEKLKAYMWIGTLGVSDYHCLGIATQTIWIEHAHNAGATPYLTSFTLDISSLTDYTTYPMFMISRGSSASTATNLMLAYSILGCT